MPLSVTPVGVWSPARGRGLVSILARQERFGFVSKNAVIDRVLMGRAGYWRARPLFVTSRKWRLLI